MYNVQITGIPETEQNTHEHMHTHTHIHKKRSNYKVIQRNIPKLHGLNLHVKNR